MLVAAAPCAAIDCGMLSLPAYVRVAVALGAVTMTWVADTLEAPVVSALACKEASAAAPSEVVELPASDDDNGANESKTPSGDAVNSTTYSFRATCAADDSEGVKSASARRCLKKPLAGRYCREPATLAPPLLIFLRA